MSTGQPKIERAAPPRERLLAAAEQLFYEEGVSSVGIDKVIERAGVAKASLYSHFKGKDDLVRSYLAERHKARRGRIESRLAGLDDPREQLLAVFDLLAEATADPAYRGCAFARATAETPPDSLARLECSSSRGWLRSLLVDLLTRIGVGDPSLIAAQLMMLYDGVSAAVQMDGDHQAAQKARRVVELLVPAAPR